MTIEQKFATLNKIQLVMDTCKTYPHVLKQILENPDIRDQFILSLIYHTNRIEGSTLTEAETSAILFQDVALPDKSLIEHLEVKNHQTALQFGWKRENWALNRPCDSVKKEFTAGRHPARKKTA